MRTEREKLEHGPTRAVLIYGITLRSFEELNVFDKSIVDEAFKIASKKREYNSPTFLLCLIGFEIDHFIEYDPENL